MARVGRFTSLPCSPFGPLSSISRLAMRRAKSQAPSPAILGASIFPLKQRCAGPSPAASAPTRIPRPPPTARGGAGAPHSPPPLPPTPPPHAPPPPPHPP